MCIAGSEFRPGIANTDHRSPIEQIGWKTLVLHPAPVDEAHLVGLAEPIPAP